MKSFYHAYQAYEKKVEMGVFSKPPRKTYGQKSVFQGPLLTTLGDALIQAGFALKQRRSARPTMSGSPAFGKLNQ